MREKLVEEKQQKQKKNNKNLEFPSFHNNYIYFQQYNTITIYNKKKEKSE